MKKGEVWNVEIPGVDGHEQRGLRPAVFIANTKTNIVMIIPCTSNLLALHFPFTVKVKPTASNGLDNVSVALVLQLRAIDKRRLIKKIGKLDAKITRSIDFLMRRLLGL